MLELSIANNRKHLLTNCSAAKSRTKRALCGKTDKTEIFMGLWTLTHLYQILPTFLILAVIAFIVAKALGKCKPQLRYIPLQIIAVVLLVLEVMKQINAAKGGSYDLYALPFHYCSLFLYVLPLHAFYRGKYSHVTDTMALVCLASLFLDMLLMPQVIYSADSIKSFFDGFSSFHTVVFHNLVVFYFMLTVALKLYSINTKHDMKIMTVFLAIYVIIAATLSYSLKVNFHNLYKCNIPFIEDVRLAVVDAIGVFGTLIYVFALFILTILFAYAAYFLTRLIIKCIDKLSARKAAE